MIIPNFPSFLWVTASESLKKCSAIRLRLNCHMMPNLGHPMSRRYMKMNVKRMATSRGCELLYKTHTLNQPYKLKYTTC